MIAVLLALLLAQEPSYSFFVDGRPEIPETWSLDGSDRLREGDVIRVRGYLMTLGAPGVWKFSTARRDEGLLLLEGETGPVPVAARAFRGFRDGHTVLINPLDSMPEEVRRGLRGFTAGAAVPKLKGLLPPSAAVTLDTDAMDLLPELPEDLRVLAIALKPASSAPALKGGLRWLQVSGPPTSAIEAAPAGLRVLVVRGARVAAADLSKSAKELRVLDVGGKGVADLAWAAGLKELRGLRAESTAVTDLKPLSHLERLEWLEADGSSIASLPDGKLPALRRLRLLATGVGDKELAAFAAAHPECRVLRGFEEAMRAGLDGVDRLVVRSGGTCHRKPDQEKLLAEVKDPAEVAKVVKGIRLDEAAGTFHCMCCGEPTLEFFRGAQLQVVIGFHHGKSLRWPGGWPADAALSDEGRAFLVDWLAGRGVTGPKETLERERREEEARKGKLARAGRGLPDGVARELEDGGAKFVRALRDHVPDPAARVRALFRILGSGNGPWTVYDKLDSTADAQLKSHDLAELQAQAAAALKGEDRIARRGAARFWTAVGSPLWEWAPADLAALRASVLDLQASAAHPDVRLAGLTNLGRWAPALEAKDVRARVEAAFRDPDPEVRRRAYLLAGEHGIREAIPVLESVLEGKAPEPIPLPEIPQEERELASLGGPQKIAPGGPARGLWTDVDAAALALGYLTRVEAKESIGKLPKTSYTDAALALLGDPSRLNQEHFRDAGMQATEAQLAAVEAVIRVKGRWLLKEAIGYKQNSYWWEEERVAARLARMLKEAKAPGAETLPEPAAHLDPLAAWYREHGEAYLKSLEK